MTFLELLQDIAVVLRPIVEIGFLAWLLYHFYISVAQTKAVQIVHIAFYLFTIYAVSLIFDLDVFLTIFRALMIPICVFVFILYQAELRRAFTMNKGLRLRPFFGIGQETTADEIDAVLSACKTLSEKKRGALVVFPREVALKNIVDTGTRLNADLTSALLLTIFDHDTPLHDGAAIVQGGKIVAAGCFLPVSEQSEIKKTFGTRHRAALGMSEESDAVILVVSEETSCISLTYNANLYYDLEPEVLKRILLQLLNFKEANLSEIKEAEYNATE